MCSMNQQKIKIARKEIEGHNIYDLCIEVSFILESLASYEIASQYNRQIFEAKDNIERMKVISNYLEIC